jgi:hypothetical protein
MEYMVKRGFGAHRVKEYFVGQTDGDTLGSIIAGPFESEAQSREALDALRPLYFSPLCIVGGHLVPFNC